MSTFEPNVEGFALDEIDAKEPGLIEATLRKGRPAVAAVLIINDGRVKLGPPRQYRGTLDQWRAQEEELLRTELRQVAERLLGDGATEYYLMLHLKDLKSKLV